MSDSTPQPEPREQLAAMIRLRRSTSLSSAAVADAILAAGWVHSSQLEQVGWWSEINQRFNRMWEHNPNAPMYRGDREPVFRVASGDRETS